MHVTPSMQHVRVGMIGMALALAMAWPIARGAAPWQNASGAVQDAKPQEKAKPQPGDLLAGPQVEDAEDAQGKQPMAGMERPRRQRTVPLQLWLTALRGLDLTDEQQDQVRSVAQAFRDAEREFQQTHGSKMRELGEKLRQAQEAGTRPDGELRDAFQSLQQQSPKPEEYQQRIWKLLDDQQQQRMRARLDELERDFAQRQQDRREVAGERRRAAQEAGRSQPGKPAPSMDDIYTPRRRRALQNRPLQSPPAPSAGQVAPLESAPPDQPPSGAPGADRAQPSQRGRALDPAGERRLRFLRSRQQGSDAGRMPGPQERQFNFDEDRPKTSGGG